MQYLSPSTLLGETISTPLDKKAIQLGRKKLLAELELTAADSLEVHGIALTKGNIIDYFEDLQQENVLEYHNAVEEDAVLKTFLEDHYIEEGTGFNYNSLYHEISFIRWISPYFFTSFTTLTDLSFKQREKSQLSAILDTTLIMTDYDMEQAWTSISKILANNIALLEYYKQKGEQGKGDKETFNNATPLMGFEYISLIALLPEYRFGEMRNKYAFAIEEAAIYTFNKNKSHRPAAEAWIENALQLAVSPELQTELSNKLKEMRRITEGKKSSKGWGLARFAWLLIFVVAKVFTCNSFNSTPSFDVNKPPVVSQPYDSTEILLTDSTKKHLLDSFKHIRSSP